jgi:DNA gyrase subunit A
MMVTDQGKLIRMPVEDIRIAGRKTQGVILFRMADKEKVVSVTKLEADASDEEELEAETGSEVLGEAVAEESESTEINEMEVEVTDEE